MKNTLKIILAFILSFCLTVSFAQVIEPIEDDSIDEGLLITYIESMPEFIGGDKARIKYFEENTEYPKEAQNKKIEGTVYVTFVVEKDSSITNVQILRGVCESIDIEAVRVVKHMPKWKPASQRSKLIRCQYNLPIKFMLPDNYDSKGKIKLTKKDK